jgi:hypothetical protein
MDQSKFKEVEQKYNDLKERLNYGALNPEEIKKELKKMMVVDEDGKYWMIGAKTGKWYFHDGTDWKEGNPYEKEEEEAEVEDIEGTISLSLPGTDSMESEERQDDEEEAVVEVRSIDEEAGEEILVESEEKDEPYTLGEKEEEAVVEVPSIDEKAGEEIPVESEEKEEPYTDTEPYPLGEEEEEAVVEIPAIDEETRAEILKEVKVKAEPYTIEEKEEEEAGEETRVDVEEKSELYARPYPLGEEETIVELIDEEVEAETRVDVEEKVRPYTKKEEATAPPIPPMKKVVIPKAVEKKDELVITSIKMSSLIFFLGGLGLILGVLLGAGFGIFKTFLPKLQESVPAILNDTRGGIAGGLIFAGMGGIGGFFISAAAAVIVSGTYSLIAYLFGGIRLKIKQKK